MSKFMLRTAGAAAVLVLGTATFAGTAFAGDQGGNDTATAVGCSAKNTQDGGLITANVLGNLLNGNNILSNCYAKATAK